MTEKIDLQSLANEYLTYLDAVRGLSEHTRLAYGRDLDAWEQFLVEEGSSLLKATSNEAGAFLRSLGKHGLAPASVNRVLSCLRGFYRFLVRSGKATNHPFSAIRSLKKPRHLPTFLFEKEMATLLKNPRDDFQGCRDRLLFELMYSTGCRVSEVCSIQLKDFSNDRTRLKVLGKGNKIRTVFMTPSSVAALQQYLPLREEKLKSVGKSFEAALFLNRRGDSLGVRGVAKILFKYVQMSGIVKRVSPHTFRHTFATHLLSEGLDVRVVQELLGHSRLETTQVYTHLSLDRLKDVVRQAHPHG